MFRNHCNYRRNGWFCRLRGKNNCVDRDVCWDGMVVIHALNGTARYWTYHEILPLLSEFSNNTRTKPPGALFANGSPSPHATIPAASDVDLAPGPTGYNAPGAGSTPEDNAILARPSWHDRPRTTILARPSWHERKRFVCRDCNRMAGKCRCGVLLPIAPVGSRPNLTASAVIRGCRSDVDRRETRRRLKWACLSITRGPPLGCHYLTS
jgi:hypothetical protein